MQTVIPGSSQSNRDRAELVALKGDVALIGISNQGLFMPLVAAARPIKRIVFINAVIPHPGQSFWEASRGQRVFASQALVRCAGRTLRLGPPLRFLERIPNTSVATSRGLFKYGLDGVNVP